VPYSAQMYHPGYIACGLLMACGTAALAYRSFSPRYAAGWKWRGSSTPVSLRSRILMCATAASGTAWVLAGMPILLALAPFAMMIVTGLSSTVDHSRNARD
jgi:hypothetical protein